jgi:hypothetical protein
VTVDAVSAGLGFSEAARAPARRLLALRRLRKSLDAEERLNRLADLGSLFGGGAGKRHFDSLAREAAGRDVPGSSGTLMREEGGKVVEGGPYVPGHSYVTE